MMCACVCGGGGDSHSAVTVTCCPGVQGEMVYSDVCMRVCVGGGGGESLTFSCDCEMLPWCVVGKVSLASG